MGINAIVHSNKQSNWSIHPPMDGQDGSDVDARHKDQDRDRNRDRDDESGLVKRLEVSPLMLASTMKSIFKTLYNKNNDNSGRAYDAFTTKAVSESKLVGVNGAGHNGPLWVYVDARFRDAFEHQPTADMKDRFKQLSTPPDCSSLCKERFDYRAEFMREKGLVHMKPKASKRPVHMVTNSHLPKGWDVAPVAAAAAAATSGNVQILAQDDDDDEARYDLVLSIGLVLYDPIHAAIMMDVCMNHKGDTYDASRLRSLGLQSDEIAEAVDKLCNDMFMVFDSKKRYKITLVQFLDACMMKAKEMAAAAAAAAADEDTAFLEELQAKIEASVPKMTKRLTTVLANIEASVPTTTIPKMTKRLKK